MSSINAADAQRDFAALLRRVQEGEAVTIMDDGQPVAEVRPAVKPRSEAEREAAWKALLDYLHQMEPRVVGPWTRDDMYERDGR